MAFNTIKPIPTDRDLLERALSAGRRAMVKHASSKARGETRAKEIENARLDAINSKIQEVLGSIIEAFPKTVDLSAFYR
ncbi:MAG: hypothetical protein ABIH41_00040, partial [Nanoarchaeota archaeon]